MNNTDDSKIEIDHSMLMDISTLHTKLQEYIIIPKAQPKSCYEKKKG
jgi:hypothetical protein